MSEGSGNAWALVGALERCNLIVGSAGPFIERKRSSMALTIGRVYDDPNEHQGKRVLVDRLWPRGFSKDRAALDHWAKDVAPSRELRTWYGHLPDRFAEFTQRYRVELQSQPANAAFAELQQMVRDGDVVLLTATRDVKRSAAEVLAEVLDGESR